MRPDARVVVCGAGIAGVSAAYFLSAAGFRNIVLVDDRPPLTLTSDRSTECYRNWWSDSELLAFMDRSIDWMDQLATASANTFRMNRRGYLYLTGDAGRVPDFHAQAARISEMGAGPLRVHEGSAPTYSPARAEGFTQEPAGADLLLGREAIRRYFPYVTEEAVAALHVRRAGWLSAQQLGMHLLETTRRQGAVFRSARITAVETARNQVTGVVLDEGEHLSCDVFINAAGPFFGQVGALMGLELPVHAEIHLKLAFEDNLRVVGRDAPLLIWSDPQVLRWNENERRMFEADPEFAWLLDRFPPGAHARPEGSADAATLLMLWDYQTRVVDPVFPTPLDEKYPEIALRGLATMLPRLEAYIGRTTRPRLDGGYYLRTRENRPLIGATPIQGAYLIGALSGYGIMSACAAGELLASAVTETPAPSYARAFSLARYQDPTYLSRLESWSDTGEL